MRGRKEGLTLQSEQKKIQLPAALLKTDVTQNNAFLLITKHKTMHDQN